MTAKSKCSIFFQMIIETPMTNTVFISGDILELGDWDPYKSHKLETNEQNYPVWASQAPLILEQGTKFQFKCVVMDKENLQRWETLPNDSNRRYKARYQTVTLKGTENKVEGREIVEKSENMEKLAQKVIEKIDSEKKSDDMSMSLHLDEKTIYKKRNLNDSFNPFSFAESCSDDSEENAGFSSSFISLEHQDSQELIADKIDAKLQLKHMESEKIEEILSPKTPESLENYCNDDISEIPQKHIKKATAFNAFNNLVKEKKMHLPEIFQQIKEKTKKINSTIPKLIIENTPDDFKEFPSTLEKNEHVIIVSRFLPIRVKKTETNWEVIQNEEINIINLINCLYLDTSKEYEDLIFVGRLKEDIPESDREEIQEFLLQNHKCLPVFLDSKQKSKITNIYKQDEVTAFDLVANNYYFSNESLEQTWEQRNVYWDIWVTLNKDYADNILKIMKENTMVVICEYNLLLIPTYLMQEFSKPLIALYFNMNFPSFENFRLVPYKEEILNGLLSSSIICFNDYDHISEFFTTLSILKGIEYECKQGVTYFKYMGRKIYVRIKMPNIDPDRIDILKKEEDFNKVFLKTVALYTNYNLVMGVDPASDLSGLEMKFLLFFKFVKETKNKFHLKLLQFVIKNPYTSLFHSDLNIEFIRKINDAANKINREYMDLVNNENFPPPHQKKLIDIQNLTIPQSEFISLLTIARIYLKTSIKSVDSLDVMSFIASNKNFGYALISEFLNLNKMCSTILRFNPLRYVEFKDKILYILHVKRNLTALLQADDLLILKKSNISSWLESLLIYLKRVGDALKKSRIENIEKNDNVLLTKMILVNEKFQYLPLDKIVSDYKKSRNRMILLDYEGTLVKYNYYTCITRTFKSYSDRFNMVSLTPSEMLIKDIMYLSQDPDNFLYIITGNKVEYLDHWFGHLINVGLAAEYGFFYKNKGNNKWGNLFSMDWSWKEIVKKIFEHYKKNTEGSEIESKDSCIAWKYHEVQQDFGKKQAGALISHLESSLEYFKQIDIFHGNNYIEVRPKGINKGTMAEVLMTKWINERKKIDFLLCVGDGLSDEEMFISIKKHMNEKPRNFVDRFEPYSCVVGKKPSQASFYLNDVSEVLNLLHLLKEASE